MVKCRLYYLAVLLLFPLMAQAQDNASKALDECIEELNAKCPLVYDVDWSINSFTSVGDRYELVDVEIPAVLSMFFTTLTTDTDNVKQLWVRQLNHFGKDWKRYVAAVTAANRRTVLNVHTRGSGESVLLTLYPSNF